MHSVCCDGGQSLYVLFVVGEVWGLYTANCSGLGFCSLPFDLACECLDWLHWAARFHSSDCCCSRDYPAVRLLSPWALHWCTHHVAHQGGHADFVPCGMAPSLPSGLGACTPLHTYIARDICMSCLACLVCELDLCSLQ
jgi:hypothetical protein